MIESSRIEARIGRENAAIAVIHEALVLIGHAKAKAELVGHLKRIPERKRVFRQLAQTQSGVAKLVDLLAIEIRIARLKRPEIGDLAGQLHLETLNFRINHVERCWIVIIGLRRALLDLE